MPVDTYSFFIYTTIDFQYHFHEKIASNLKSNYI